MRLTNPCVLFRCVCCGACCRDSGRHRRRIVLTQADAHNIEKFTGLRVTQFCEASHVTAPFRYVMRKDAGTCMFLNEDSMCRVYDHRPMICRCYPFSVEVDDVEITFLTSSKECPGLGRGKLLGKRHFERLAQEVIGNFKSSKESASDARSE